MFLRLWKQESVEWLHTELEEKHFASINAEERHTFAKLYQLLQISSCFIQPHIRFEWIKTFPLLHSERNDRNLCERMASKVRIR